MEILNYIKLLIKIIGVEKIISFEQIDSGQLNRVFLFNNKFVIRFSDGRHDGRNFLREEKIINVIAKRVSVPEIIFSDFSFEKIQLDVIVLKKITGITLAKKWLQFSYAQQKKIICQLCDELKKLHRLPVEDFNFLPPANSWSNIFKKNVESCIAEAEIDKRIDQKSISYMKEYFKNNSRVLDFQGTQALVHGDIHFENILISGNRITALLDFEHAEIAPIDFELAKIINFCLFPQKFVEPKLKNKYDEQTLMNVINLFKENYKELFISNFLKEKLKIYLIPDVIWGFKQELSSGVYCKGIAKKTYEDIYLNNKIEKKLNL